MTPVSPSLGVNFEKYHNSDLPLELCANNFEPLDPGNITK